MSNVNQQAIDLPCQVVKNDFLRVFDVGAPNAIEFAVNYAGQPPRSVRIHKDDIRRLQGYLDAKFPAGEAPKPVAPGREFSFDGLGSKLLRIEPVPGSDQLVLNVCDSDGKHHIVMDKAEATRLANRLYWEYLPQPSQVRDYHAAAAPKGQEAMPAKWLDQPGTMSMPVPGYHEPFEACLVDEGTKVELSWDHALMGLRLDGKELDGLIDHLQHCRHHMHSMVRVKEVPGPGHHPMNLAPVMPFYVVMDMQGEPQCVLQSQTAVAQYLSTNKLRVAQ